ncbi:hypothetical protein JTE90_008251 [Oedothorax gibbosus]|uniref:Uncharacterized protein n=1 Tax=Oedothorax gibbosus TaxID=931172 RepID=A0AAV6TN30_9ARAC|nr:hypothetical protein JTE90_008251 [Oedothorax gibbosus]
MISSPLYSTYLSMCDRKKNRKVTCPFTQCQTLEGGGDMTFSHYWKVHVKEVHKMKTLLECPFCLGKFRWMRKDLTSEIVNRHRMDCAKECFPELFPGFQTPHKLPEMPTQYETASGPCSTCVSAMGAPRKSGSDVLSGRSRVKQWGSFYREVGQEPPFLKGPFPAAHVSFSEASGLGDVMWPIVHQFLQKTHTWYHVSIRVAVWKEFEIHILRKKGVYVLPYWTLCDGSKQRSRSPVPASTRHHRHMVLVLEKSVNIDREWRTLLKMPNKAAKLKLCVDTIDHLINTLFYVSNPHAQCDGHVETLCDEGGQSHYYLNRRLYPHAKLAMHMLYRGGLQSYVDVRGKPRSARGWYQVVRGKGANRHVPVGMLQIPLEGCALPFSAHLEPSHVMWTDVPPEDVPYVWLYQRDQVMVLRSNPALGDLRFADWYMHQMNRRNCFLNAVHDDKYMLGLRHRKSVNDMQWVRQEMTSQFEEEKKQMRLFRAGPDVNVVRELQEEMDALRERLTRAETETALEVDRERRRLADENDRLRRDLERKGRWSDSVQKLHYEDRIRQLERERNEMSAEVNYWKKRAENAEHARIQLYEREREHLTDELKDVKQQLRGAQLQLWERLTEQKDQYEERLAEQRTRLVRYEKCLVEQKDQYEKRLAEQRDKHEQRLAEQRDKYEQRLAEQSKELNTLRNMVTVQSSTN